MQGPQTADRTAALVERMTDAIRVVVREARSEETAAIDELGLSFAQFRALDQLGRESEPIALGELGARLGLSAPAASRAVDALVRRGLVSRSECAEDRRRRLLALTEEGERTIGQLVELRIAGLDRWIRSLTPRAREALEHAAGLLLEESERPRGASGRPHEEAR